MGENGTAGTASGRGISRDSAESKPGIWHPNLKFSPYPPQPCTFSKAPPMSVPADSGIVVRNCGTGVPPVCRTTSGRHGMFRGARATRDNPRRSTAGEGKRPRWFAHDFTASGTPNPWQATKVQAKVVRTGCHGAPLTLKKRRTFTGSISVNIISEESAGKTTLVRNCQSPSGLSATSTR